MIMNKQDQNRLYEFVIVTKPLLHLQNLLTTISVCWYKTGLGSHCRKCLAPAPAPELSSVTSVAPAPAPELNIF